MLSGDRRPLGTFGVGRDERKRPRRRDLPRKRGGDLTIAVPPDDPRLPEYLDSLRSLTRRIFNPLKSIKVITVNGKEAVGSEYGSVFEGCGYIRDYQGYSLWAL